MGTYSSHLGAEQDPPLSLSCQIAPYATAALSGMRWGTTSYFLT